MCGRFTLRQPRRLADEGLPFGDPGDLPPRYNVAPTQPILALRAGGPPLAPRWGLVPAWAKDPNRGATLINARAETVAEKPSFRDAFRRRRCLIPADGFYEWEKGGARRPFFFHRPGDRPFAFAGLWEEWHGPDGLTLQTAAIVSTTANALMAAIHDRMPVILAPADWALWLDPAVTDPDRLLLLLRPQAEDFLATYQVTARVNNVRHDDPACLEPAPHQPRLF